MRFAAAAEEPDASQLSPSWNRGKRGGESSGEGSVCAPGKDELVWGQTKER